MKNIALVLLGVAQASETSTSNTAVIANANA